ncbi:hypothetical protein BGZ52_004407 [Haplosporangium bisporale]|nr:hypothetical protein BGZ52_004407 [Haplosporangium bisporale]
MGTVNSSTHVRWAAAILIGALTPVALMGIITALGFTPAGIIAESTAAGIMASYGGLVTSGSVCAILQSIGTTGLSFHAAALISLLGAALAAAVAALLRKVALVY